MKTLPLILSFIIGGILIFFIMRSCQEPTIVDNSEKIKEKEDSIKVLEERIIDLYSERDSLMALGQQVDTVLIENENRIDEAIAKDSANARTEFNQALTENGVIPDPIPDNPNFVSFRDLGNSAKLLAKIPRLELKINYLNGVIDKDQQIFEDYNHQIKAYQELKELQRLALLNCEQRLEDEQSFWNSKELWFGLGVIGTTAIVFATGALR